MKTALEILNEEIHNVGKGIYECEDRVCDVADEIIAACNKCVDQYIKTAHEYAVKKVLEKKLCQKK